MVVVASYELFGWMSTLPNIYHCAALKSAPGEGKEPTPTTTVVVVFQEVKRVIKGLKV